MKFVKFIIASAGDHLRFIILVTLCAGLLQGLTMYVVGLAIDDVAAGEASFHLLALFLLCIFCYYQAYKYATVKITKIAQKTVSEMELRVVDTLRSLGLLSYEGLDRGMVYQAVVGDKSIMIEAARGMVNASTAFSMMVVGFIFCAILSFPGFVAVVSSLAVCGWVLYLTQYHILHRRELIQEKQDDFVHSLQDLLSGFAELKMSRKKSDDLFYSEIKAKADKNNQARQELESMTSQAMAFFTSFIFIPVGVVLFVLPGFVDVPLEEAVKLVGVVMFIVFPLMGVVMLLPLISKAEMVLNSIGAFEDMVSKGCESEPVEPEFVRPEFQTLEVRDLAFAYKGQGSNGRFSINIDDFKLSRNEMVFITGGNGSGKTTFMKVLAGLYPCDSGQVLVNGRPKEDMGLDGYRGLFALTLSDFHLFDKLYGMDQVDPERVQELLTDMHLEHKVSYDEDKGLSTHELSSGQRRRLALVVACLDDRQVMLLDEVAADFDPVFRKYFYHEFLPKLRASGKTILAISHDDRYYHLADRVLRMRSGRMERQGEAGA